MPLQDFPPTQQSSGTPTTFTVGSMIFIGSNRAFAESNSSIFWDNTTKVFQVHQSSLTTQGVDLKYRTSTDGLPNQGDASNLNSGQVHIVGVNASEFMDLSTYAFGHMVGFRNATGVLEFHSYLNGFSSGYAACCTMQVTTLPSNTFQVRNWGDTDGFHMTFDNVGPLFSTETATKIDFGIASATTRYMRFQQSALLPITDGTMDIGTSSNKWGTLYAGTAIRAHANSAVITLGGSDDVVLNWEAAQALSLRNGTNAQQFYVYNTYTSATNKEVGCFYWSANVLFIGSEKGSGGGSVRAVNFEMGGNTLLQLTTSQQVNFCTNSICNSDNGFDIGGTGNAFRSIYFGTQSLGGAGTSTNPTYSFSGQTGLGVYSRTTDCISLTKAASTTFAEFVGTAASAARGLSQGSDCGLFWFDATTIEGSSLRDLSLTRLGAGSMAIAGRANGQAINIQSLTELTTIAAAATTDTAIQIPAGAVVLAVSVRVTVVIPTAATFTVTSATGGTTFNTAAVAVAANTTDAGTKAGAFYQSAASAIRITPNLTPGANSGRVRVTIHYYTITAATS